MHKPNCSRVKMIFHIYIMRFVWPLYCLLTYFGIYISRSSSKSSKHLITLHDHSLHSEIIKQHIFMSTNGMLLSKHQFQYQYQPSYHSKPSFCFATHQITQTKRNQFNSACILNVEFWFVANAYAIFSNLIYKTQRKQTIKQKKRWFLSKSKIKHIIKRMSTTCNESDQTSVSLPGNNKHRQRTLK